MCFPKVVRQGVARWCSPWHLCASHMHLGGCLARANSIVLAGGCVCAGHGVYNYGLHIAMGAKLARWKGTPHPQDTSCLNSLFFPVCFLRYCAVRSAVGPIFTPARQYGTIALVDDIVNFILCIMQSFVPSCLRQRGYR